jgi:hypothetical protein
MDRDHYNDIRQIIQSANDLQNYADNWFKMAAVPTGTLTTSEFLSADIALANKKAFIESQKERSVAVLSSGLHIKRYLLTLKKHSSWLTRHLQQDKLQTCLVSQVCTLDFQ